MVTIDQAFSKLKYTTAALISLFFSSSYSFPFRTDLYDFKDFYLQDGSGRHYNLSLSEENPMVPIISYAKDTCGAISDNATGIFYTVIERIGRIAYEEASCLGVFSRSVLDSSNQTFEDCIVRDVAASSDPEGLRLFGYLLLGTIGVFTVCYAGYVIYTCCKSGGELRPSFAP